MGRSKSSCFKILPCAHGAAAGEDGSVVSERKSSRDKRWLSFRKSSTKHRAVTNTVVSVSETPSSLSKDLTESATYTDSNITALEKESEVVTWDNEKPILEKTSAVTWADEKEKTSTVTWADEKVIAEKASTVTWADEKPTVNLKEADKEFGKVDVTTSINPDESVVVVIQAAVRRFLARRKLLKLKSVVKLQATVRGYLVRVHAVGTLRCVQAIVKMQALVRTRQARLSLEKELDSSVLSEKGNRPNGMHVSMEKLLANKFARQILVSTPKAKSINIKCDPSKSDSAWKWLERWMMATSLERESQAQKPESSVKQVEDIELSSMQGENKSIFEECNSADMEDLQKQIADTVEGLKPLISSDPENTNSLLGEPTSASASDNQIADLTSTFENSPNLLPIKQLGLVSLMEDLPNSGISEMQSESTNNNIAGQPLVPNSVQYDESLSVGSRKEINPESIAAPTKFGNLNSEGNLAISTNEDITKPEPESLSSAIVKETETNNKNSTMDLVENAVCETELPSLSMIHSPGRHKDELVNDVELEVKNELNSGSINITKPVEQNSEAVVEAIQSLSSEAASPRSHFTVAESQGTPSTQISVNSKNPKTDKSVSSMKRRSLSAGRRSPANYKPETGLRSSLDHLPKSTKVRLSLDKTDSGDSSSLPSYMQLTESMKAKAFSSPRSSPDVPDRDIFISKRHSLPFGNTRQESPRIVRSASLAQHVAKGNDHSHERRWQV